jgi:hypothetical protein
MTYGELKDRVLQLIFSYSIAGDEIELSYNNQEDYVKMIPGLLSTVQSYIYQQIKFEDVIRLCDLDHEDLGNGETMYHLPEDFIKMKPGLIIPRGRLTEPRYQRMFYRSGNYKLLANKKLITASDLPEATLIEYEKRPLPIDPNVKDNYVLRNTDDINEIIPFYIAGWLVMHDDAFKYAALMNEFESRLAVLRANSVITTTEENSIFDAYAGFDDGGCWGDREWPMLI